MKQTFKEIIYSELPQVGEKFQKGDAIGVVETVEKLYDIFMPTTGAISKIELKNNTLILEVDQNI